MNGDFVSVVIPAYNAEAFIGDAIASVREQTYPRWELIVVDDCSTDETVRVACERAERDPRVKIVRSPANGGTSVARNIGLSQCGGRYVAFLDADDVWMTEKMQRQLEFMGRQGIAFSFTAYQKFGSNGLGSVIGAPRSVSWREMLKGNRIGCSTVMIDTRVFPRLSFPTGLGRQEDYALWLSLLRQGGLAYGLDEPLVRYRVHEASKSARKLRSIAAQWSVYRDLERLPLLHAAWYLTHYAIRGTIKELK